MANKLWMQPPGGGEPIEVEDDGAGVNLTPLLVKGFRQCAAPFRELKPKQEGASEPGGEENEHGS